MRHVGGVGGDQIGLHAVLELHLVLGGGGKGLVHLGTISSSVASNVTVVPTAHQMAEVVAPLVGQVDPWVGAPAMQDLDVLANEVGDLVSLE